MALSSDMTVLFKFVYGEEGYDRMEATHKRYMALLAKGRTLEKEAVAAEQSYATRWYARRETLERAYTNQ